MSVDLTKYLTARGDRRLTWTSVDREDPGVRHVDLTKAEVRARVGFMLGVARDGLSPAAALTRALDLDAGPIPGVQTVEAFRAYWTPARVAEIAERWRTSRHSIWHACTALLREEAEEQRAGLANNTKEAHA